MTVAQYILIAFPAVFVILNPFVAATTFISVTEGVAIEAQHRIAKRACWTAFGVLLVFAIAGQLLFQLFQITVEAFRIAGGIVLFTIGLEMLNLKPLHTKQTDEEREEILQNQHQDVAVVPLGIPIMSGPGAITTVIVLMAEINWRNKMTGLLQVSGLLLSVAASCLIFYFIMVNARKLFKVFPKTVLGVMTRIMGLILTVIATQFVINGVRDLLPKLANFSS